MSRWDYEPRLEPTDGTKLTWCDDCERYCQDFAGHDCGPTGRAGRAGATGDKGRLRACKECGSKMGTDK